ncbi:hypothetical protein RHGRI_010394 [Rhododendron griersonianum]|uniref:Uncharacterized protein n=1 Tax=Rhododendron griersonianum TaxID=479676 RepID=A0AAV6KJ59_9ERIC|nr:hypothetical protein RHGRI_010394 [Rhododendron griersonianum]
MVLQDFQGFDQRFSKHMKVEEQVAVLKNRVNIGCGTPSRIQKLIDVEALGLSRLAVIVLDRHTDVKGYSLFTLPQVRLFLLLPLPLTIVLSYAIEMNSGTCISATSTHGCFKLIFVSVFMAPYQLALRRRKRFAMTVSSVLFHGDLAKTQG